jgi:hypothetical protein
MKVNPIGIQAYEQLTQREQAPPAPAETQVKSTPEKPVQITPQAEAASSKLAVKAPAGSYADLLSPEEKQALDLLFSRFRDSGRFGPGYARDNAAAAESVAVGNILDVKA